MNIIGVIPARMASSRFPGKPLAKIHGIPMVGHVYHRSKMANLLSEVYVATCDTEIYDYVESIGGKAIMTGSHHERASDRVAEALLKIEQQSGKKVDIVVLIQGDEPMVTPDMIEDAVKPMINDERIKVVNLMAEIKTIKEFEDPNEVKVVVDNNSNALYFSREPIPSLKKGAKKVRMLKQVCIIPFRREYLLTYSRLPPTPLEIAESIDMLRVLEHGDKVKMIFTDKETYSVDTKEDLEWVVKQMEKDNLMSKYRGVKND